MNYVTTNIRFEEGQYHELKQEALKNRKSLSALVREKIGTKNKKRSRAEVEKLMAEVRFYAQKNRNMFGKKTSVQVVREMRDNAKW